jgi:hypothetical protein
MNVELQKLTDVILRAAKDVTSSPLEYTDEERRQARAYLESRSFFERKIEEAARGK